MKQGNFTRGATRPLLTAALLTAPLLTASLLAAGAAQAQAQTWPSRPIRMVVPYGTGGATDAIARLLSTKMAESLKQPVVVENKPGANSAIGTADVARSRPDGYSVLIVSSAHVVNPFVSKDLTYDARKDFAAVTHLTRMPSIFVVHPSVPANSVKELIDEVKKNPTKYFYAIAGGLSNGHVTMERFKIATGTSIEPVMFKGAGPAALEVAAGRVQMMMVAPPGIKPFIQDGRVRVLASTGSRGPVGMPPMPTIVDAGLPQLEAWEWLGLLAPAGTPKAIVDRTHAEVAAVLKDKAVVDGLVGQSMEVVGAGPEPFQAFLNAELDKMSKLTATVKLAAE